MFFFLDSRDPLVVLDSAAAESGVKEVKVVTGPGQLQRATRIEGTDANICQGLRGLRSGRRKIDRILDYISIYWIVLVYDDNDVRAKHSRIHRLFLN